MPKKKPAELFLCWGIPLCLLALLCLLLGGALGIRRTGASQSGGVAALTQGTLTLNGTQQEITLPYRISGLAPRTQVVVTMEAAPAMGDVLYIKSVYAPLKVYADGRLIYSYGEEGSYPAFFSDPPTQVATAPLPANGSTVQLEFVYLSSAARSTLMLHEPLMGSDTAILRYLLAEMGPSLCFSILLFFIGLLLCIASFFLIPLEPRSRAIFWLGVFSFSTSIWTFAECNLSVFLTGMPSLLYLLAFLGLFCMPIPLYRFAICLLELQSNRLLRGVCLLLELSVGGAILLQLTGRVPFLRSMYFFHALIPASICLLAGYVLYLAKRCGSGVARRFALAFSVLGGASILEVLNYRFRFLDQISQFFQIGIFCFILLSMVLAEAFLRDAFALRERNQALSFRLGILAKQIEIQKERNALLLQNAQAVKEQRHDLRHQYAALKRLCEDGRYPELLRYIDTLVADIPVESHVEYCENEIVNAIVSYYAAMADQAGIETTLRLGIPAQLPRISDSSLCILVGNLLENAIEACTQMHDEDGKRFIRLCAALQGDTLCLTMDNSFSGQYRKRDGEFLSHKRDEIGTGLISIRSVAEKHGGQARFEVDGRVFLSSVSVRAL